MSAFHGILLLAAFLCSLVAGFLFAFAAVVMPGVGRLDDHGFIRSFQAIDGVIQNNQPLFLLVWVGSVPAVIGAAVLGMWMPALAGPDRLLIVIAALVYVFGVQLPTAAINIPLNNRLRTLDAASMDQAARHRARADFERRWNRSNRFRALCATLASFLLMVLLLRL